MSSVYVVCWIVLQTFQTYFLHTGVTVYLAPLGSLPPGEQDTPGYLNPWGGKLPRGSFTPGGQAAQGAR